MTLLADHAAAAASSMTALPVLVVGAGPVGLAAAAQLLERGIEPLVLEAGSAAGSAVAQWGHVRLFSPWKHVVDAAATRLLEKSGWSLPSPEEAPMGRELVELYLTPLAAVLGSRVRYGARVDSVSRRNMDRTRSEGRDSTPFVVRLADGEEIEARAVIDASGTFAIPNSVLSTGLAPRRIAEVSANLTHGLPDVLGADRDRFAGKHTLVVGAGHSAANTLLALARLADEVPGTTATWVIRSSAPTRVYGAEADELSGRASLGEATRALVDEGRISLIDSFAITDVIPSSEGLVSVIGTKDSSIFSLDAHTVVVATGFRPNLDMLREVRVSLDEVVEAPTKLAPLIDPNLHSCGTVPPHGVDELSHPEPGFWLAGMKSYGRAPTFLLLTGYEQVRSIADELAGNREAARRIDLVLPETGVCSTAVTPGMNLLDDSSCCQ